MAAPPVPTSAFFTTFDGYSDTGSPARLPQFERRLRVHVDEDFLDHAEVGFVDLDHPRDGRVQFEQARGHRGFFVGADLAIGDMADAAARFGDDAPSGADEARVDA